MEKKLFQTVGKKPSGFKLSTTCALCALGTCLSTTSSLKAMLPTAAPAAAAPGAAAQQTAPAFVWRPILREAVAQGTLSVPNQRFIDQLLTTHVEAFTGIERDFRVRFNHAQTKIDDKDATVLEFNDNFWRQIPLTLRAYEQWVWANEFIRRRSDDWTGFYDVQTASLFRIVYDLCFKEDSLSNVFSIISSLATANNLPAPAQTCVEDLYTFSQYELFSTLKTLPRSDISDEAVAQDLVLMNARILGGLNDETFISRVKRMTKKMETLQGFRAHSNLVYQILRGRGGCLKTPGHEHYSFSNLANDEPKADSSVAFNISVMDVSSRQLLADPNWNKQLERVRTFAAQVAAEQGVALMSLSDLHGNFPAYGRIEQVAQLIASQCPLMIVFSGDSAQRAFSREPACLFESPELIQFKSNLNHTVQGNMFYTFGNHDTQDGDEFFKFLANWQRASQQAAQNYEAFGSLLSNVIGGFRDPTINQTLLPYTIDGNILVYPICMNYANQGLGYHEQPVLDANGQPVLDEDGYPQIDYIGLFTSPFSRALENIDTDRCERCGAPNNFVYTYDGSIFQRFRHSNFEGASCETVTLLQTFGLKKELDDDEDNGLTTIEELNSTSQKLWETDSAEAPGKINPITKQTAVQFTTGVRQLSQQNPAGPLTVVLAAHDDYAHLLHFFEEGFFLLPPQHRPAKKDLERMRIYAACGHMHTDYAIAKFFNIFSAEDEWVQVPSVMVAPGIYGSRISLWNLGDDAHLGQWDPQQANTH